ncbi:MAG: NAD(P)-binding protein [Limnochordia bacterium]|jgi:heterodisulfide reductase subunit A-like polyferredoxin
MAKQPHGKTIGSVLVVGGGIAGIQASLDLAESGYYVYLVEKSPSIGGTMSQLDKTFPTNDCSMCILAPKLVDSGRHLNIEVMTYADLVDLTGEPGNFRARIQQRPRYVDADKCTGCGECAEVCPVVVKSEFDEGLGERKAIFRPFPQAYPSVFGIDRHVEKRPCQLACPAGCNVQGYVALIAQGKYKEAVALIKETIPLPGVMGRVCVHPCEGECKRGQLEGAISIAALKRFAADQVPETVHPWTPKEKTGEKVAIIGSGPAGLSCAYYLALEGHRPTIFEALPEAGGMLRYGIPAYRLPREVLDKEIQDICSLGVEIITNTAFGRDITLEDLGKQGYKSVFLGVGAQGSRKLGIPGEEAEGVVHGVDYLRDVNLGVDVPTGRKVGIVGGGNVAMDAARTLLRTGAQVYVFYRRSRSEMPALPEEIEGAIAEGVKFHFLTNPIQVLTEEGRLRGVRCQRMELGAPDASGRRRPEPIPGSEFDVELDMLIPAIGQTVLQEALLEAGVAMEHGTIKVDPLTLATSVPGVFAGGDAVLGPQVAVDAIAQGKEGAISIGRYLAGEDLTEDRPSRPKPAADLGEIPRGEPEKPRIPLPELPPMERIRGMDEVHGGYTSEQARMEAERCLNCGVCSDCFQCVKACKAEAICHDQQGELKELEVGAVVLCPGFEEFDPSSLMEYGYNRYDNVVTSIEFERILSASGPYGGHLIRPSDQKEPKRIAWLQCVGSRDEQAGCGYCSSVCCTYAIKEAMIAKEHSRADLETSIFFMDIRTHGKDFEKYYERGKNQGIRFVRSKVYDVQETDSGDLRLRYTTEEGGVQEEEFDMVVLSVGLRPPKEAGRQAESFGLKLDEYGFCSTDPLQPVQTSRPGVFVAGAFSGPKDIPETVVQASAAAAAASAQLAQARHELVREKTYPLEREVAEEAPRIGVFVCHCGINIGGVVNVPEVRDYARTLPYVVYAEDNMYTCSEDTQKRIKDKIEELKLNRVVVASCSPRTHEPLFRETVKEGGLNPHLFEMANIRDQCSWVHMDDKQGATEKAKDLVRMVVAKAALNRGLPAIHLAVKQSVLIIGGGATGLTGALNLAAQGFEVHLVEKSDRLGGQSLRLQKTIEGREVAPYLAELIHQVKNNEAIHVYLNTEVVAAEGFVGNFKSTLRGEDGSTRQVDHGAVLMAVGADEYRPKEYAYGQEPNVCTAMELEEALGDDQSLAHANRVVMIQCVGSRSDEHPYCSRICCSQAVKNALELKRLDPNREVWVLYRDVRTYGFAEDYYRKAREAGVLFIRFDEERPPQVVKEGTDLYVTVTDPLLGQEVALPADLVVLGTGVVPNPGAFELAQLYKVPLNQDGFFLEAHVKLRPCEFATDGIFLAGTAHSPKNLSESIGQAQGAAARITALLSKDSITGQGEVASVDAKRCLGCGTCVDVCAFGAVGLDLEKNVAQVNEALCKGCGTCSAACRSGAIDVAGFSNEQILREVDALCL